MESNYGPQTAHAEQLDAEKYRATGETFKEGTSRVASALKDSDRHYREVREITLDQRFLFAGRIRSSMGSMKNTTSYNCFVSGRIPDSFVSRDNEENSSIMHRAEQAAATLRMGGGIGYDFSTLRPRGALIKKLMSAATGPLQFMEIFDAVGGATASSGNRRGAQMAVLRIDHPDIWEFIHVKQNEGHLNRFNISIAVTDEFMRCLDDDEPFPLQHNGEIYRYVDPSELWEGIMRSTWDWAEPGVLFIDTINRMNNLNYCEELLATNPCGEQPLPAFGACLLGSFNLVKYLSRQTDGRHTLDLDQFRADIDPVVRAMDNVVDRTRYPLPEQEREAKSKRRMGLGVTGLANALEAGGYAYGSPGFLEQEHLILSTLAREAYLAGTRLAQEKGSFELFDADRYGESQFLATMDDEVRWAVAKHGIRNSHYTSIAPTGTISQTADNVSSSIEPVYKYRQERDIHMAAGKATVDLWDYGFSRLRVRGRRTSMGEVSAKEHVAVLTAAQYNVDSAVSKTVNTDGTMPWEDFKSIYLSAYVSGAKGCTTYNKDGKRAGLFRDTPEPADLPFPTIAGIADAEAWSIQAADSCEFDPATGRRSCE